MKVFFIGDRKSENSQKLNDRIIKILEKNGYKVDKSLISVNHEDDYINFEGAYKRNLKSIKDCDVIVAEITGISSGIGFLLATAINQRKPVIALFHKDYKIKPSLTLRGIKNKLFAYTEYDDKTVEQVLNKALMQVKQQLDTKFILIISPEIDRYLEWASDYKRMHKAQLVREAVEKYMNEDKDWAEFQAEDDSMVK